MNDLGDSFFYCKGKLGQKATTFVREYNQEWAFHIFSNLSVLPRHVHEAIHVATLGHVEGRPNGRGAVHDVVGTRGLVGVLRVAPILGVTFVLGSLTCQ